MADLLELKSSI